MSIPQLLILEIQNAVFTASELQISMYIYDWIERGIRQKGGLTSSVTNRQF